MTHEDCWGTREKDTDYIYIYISNDPLSYVTPEHTGLYWLEEWECGEIE